ncbi:hypothetical protein A3D88_01040 [Candidatus Peribacteria bacterium RIFCSPHIGHO2_02_FULL_52_16]|nr:MAG: hypothetical protein A2706_05685 [Candidatus Peribacteria bacterium RIFCSPHIGHO2_01_FULL_51_35]OGJ61252.1 MAG: hypothetical protein A3D88_01040 [Candidatus Peribacteria bacterium RIFCSPHIGHO2_02_FULL_52_16]
MTKFDNSEAREKRLDENAIHAFAAQLDGKDFYKIPINNAWNYWGEKNICIYFMDSKNILCQVMFYTGVDEGGVCHVCNPHDPMTFAEVSPKWEKFLSPRIEAYLKSNQLAVGKPGKADVEKKTSFFQRCIDAVLRGLETGQSEDTKNPYEPPKSK